MTRRANEIFDLFRTMQYEPFFRRFRATYLFEIEDAGNWFVSVNEGAIEIGEERREADCVIRCSEDDFSDIVEGRRNLVTAVLQGRVQVRGDVALAQRFHGFVSTLIERKRGAA